MSLSELEKERGYIVGAAARIREKMGHAPPFRNLPAVSEEDAIKNIEARKIFEESNKGHFGDSEASFDSVVKEAQPKAKWKGAK